MDIVRALGGTSSLIATVFERLLPLVTGKTNILVVL